MNPNKIYLGIVIGIATIVTATVCLAIGKVAVEVSHRIPQALEHFNTQEL